MLSGAPGDTHTQLPIRSLSGAYPDDQDDQDNKKKILDLKIKYISKMLVFLLLLNYKILRTRPPGLGYLTQSVTTTLEVNLQVRSFESVRSKVLTAKHRRSLRLLCTVGGNQKTLNVYQI